MAVSIIERIRVWFFTHLVTPLREMSWTERILLLFFGFWFGIFPIPGLSTPLLLFAFLLINRYVQKSLTVTETTVATTMNILSTPFCIALLPFWMRLGALVFQLQASCKASQILNELYVAPILPQCPPDHSSDNGFFEALSKFASCLGSATATWLMATVVVMPILLIVRSRVKTDNANAVDRVYGEFSVLGEAADSDVLDEGNFNGKPKVDRLPVSHYCRLVESGELQSMPLSQSSPDRP